MIRHFKRSKKEPLTWFLATHYHYIDNYATMGIEMAKKRCKQLEQYNISASFRLSEMYANEYNIMLKFDDEADEAEFIMRLSEGIELPGYYVYLANGSCLGALAGVVVGLPIAGGTA